MLLFVHSHPPPECLGSFLPTSHSPKKTESLCTSFSLRTAGACHLLVWPVIVLAPEEGSEAKPCRWLPRRASEEGRIFSQTWSLVFFTPPVEHTVPIRPALLCNCTLWRFTSVCKQGDGLHYCPAMPMSRSPATSGLAVPSVWFPVLASFLSDFLGYSLFFMCTSRVCS